MKALSQQNETISVRLRNALANAANPYGTPMNLIKGDKPNIREVIKNAAILKKIRNFGPGCLRELCEYIAANATEAQRKSWCKKLARWASKTETWDTYGQAYKKVLTQYA